MKLNPPETAPKLGLDFLGFFGVTPVLSPTVWSFEAGKWMVSCGVAKAGFSTVVRDTEELLGWTYLPEIDKDGNVVLMLGGASQRAVSVCLPHEYAGIREAKDKLRATQPDAEIVELAREGLEAHENYPDSPEYAICAELVRLADAGMAERHPDDVAVDVFAAEMKTKLARKRSEGKSGWQDKAQINQDQLSQMLRKHVEKGDPVDVANFCMMLHQRGEQILNLEQTK